MTVQASSAAPVAGSWPAVRAARIISIDALRGLVMLTMIFVNDLAGGGKIVPDWMVHFSDRHRKGSGMTFVDVVFPAFLFIVGMSIPFALGPRLDRGEPIWKTLGHIVLRTLSLLWLGIMMVNDPPNSEAMGWSGELWTYLMFLSAIMAFCSISPRRRGTDGTATRANIAQYVKVMVRVIGFVSLTWLAFAFRGHNDRRIISLAPFSIHTSWYGILGLIGWSYLVGSIVFLFFRGQRTAMLGCVALLLCLYAADKKGLFDNFWLERFVGIGEMLGAHPSITVAGLLMGSMLAAADMTAVRARVRFTLLFIAGTAAAAWLVGGIYGISKNDATPPWCLWACAITAALWLVLYYLCDVRPVGFIARPLAIAGQNVLLAYLLSEMLPNLLKFFGGDSGWTESSLAWVVGESAVWAVLLLGAATGLNRFGLRLKL